MKRLPEKVREEIGRLREKGRTLDEIIAHLKTLGAQVSRSSLGRYTKDVDVIGKRIQESRALAEVLVERYGSGKDNRQQTLLLELVHSQLLSMTASEAFQKEESLESMGTLSRALRDLATAAKADTDARERAQKAAMKQATAKIETKGKESGLTAKTIKKVKALLEGG